MNSGTSLFFSCFVESFFVLVCSVMIPGMLAEYAYPNHPLFYLLPVSGLVNAVCVASFVPNFFCEGCCGVSDTCPRVKLGRLWRAYHSLNWPMLL